MGGYLRDGKRLKTSHRTVQAEETVTSTTEDIVYLQDFPTKLISMLRLCANFTFGMEILLSQPRIRCNINSNSHYR